MGAVLRSADLDRLYLLLIVIGPLTLTEITQRTGWTHYRANQALYQLRMSGCVELTERKEHRGAYNPYGGRNRCGKWAAITDLEPDVMTWTLTQGRGPHA